MTVSSTSPKIMRSASDSSAGRLANVGGVQRVAKTVRDPRPLAVQVYEQVRDQIVSGQIPADTQLVQEQLAEAIGVSRTPVRDALNRLAHEGLVTWIPGTGYLVNKLTEQNVRHIYQVRQALEGLAVQLAAGRHTPAQLARLRQMVAERPGPDNESGWFEWNRDFHVALIEPGSNSLLMSLLIELWNNPVNRIITREYTRDADHVDRMVNEHLALIEAAERGDADTLVHLINEHLSEGYGEVPSVPDATS